MRSVGSKWMDSIRRDLCKGKVGGLDDQARSSAIC